MLGLKLRLPSPTDPVALGTGALGAAAVAVGFTVGVAEAGVLLGAGSLAGMIFNHRRQTRREAQQDSLAILKERNEINEQIAALG